MNFFGSSNRQDEVDQLVKQIIDNLIEQKKIVDQYNSGYRADLAEMREQIDYLVKKRVARPTIIKTVSKRFSEVTGPTVINISQSRKVVSSGATSSSTETTNLGKVLPGHNKNIYMGPNGGLYYWTKSDSGKRRKTYLNQKQAEACRRTSLSIKGGKRSRRRSRKTSRRSRTSGRTKR